MALTAARPATISEQQSQLLHDAAGVIDSPLFAYGVCAVVSALIVAGAVCYRRSIPSPPPLVVARKRVSYLSGRKVCVGPRGSGGAISPENGDASDADADSAELLPRLALRPGYGSVDAAAPTAGPARPPLLPPAPIAGPVAGATAPAVSGGSGGASGSGSVCIAIRNPTPTGSGVTPHPISVSGSKPPRRPRLSGAVGRTGDAPVATATAYTTALFAAEHKEEHTPVWCVKGAVFRCSPIPESPLTSPQQHTPPPDALPATTAPGAAAEHVTSPVSTPVGAFTAAKAITGAAELLLASATSAPVPTPHISSVLPRGGSHPDLPRAATSSASTAVMERVPVGVTRRLAWPSPERGIGDTGTGTGAGAGDGVLSLLPLPLPLPLSLSPDANATALTPRGRTALQPQRVLRSPHAVSVSEALSPQWPQGAGDGESKAVSDANGARLWPSLPTPPPNAANVWVVTPARSPGIASPPTATPSPAVSVASGVTSPLTDVDAPGASPSAAAIARPASAGASAGASESGHWALPPIVSSF